MKKYLVVFVLATMLAVSVMAFAAGKLSAGFIALSESTMTWAAAKTYCQKQGARLPLIGDSSSRSSNDSPPGTSIDGFGIVGTRWPTGLSCDSYWTGTANSELPGHAWVVECGDGGVYLYNAADQGASKRVVCTPSANE